jgi:hypothetical protein
MSNTDTGWRKRQIALEIKAENARELGLDYEPSKSILGMGLADDRRGNRQIAIDIKTENARELGLDYEQEESMKLTEEQIWACNNTGDGGAYISLDRQNVVDFARSIEREIGFAKAELWIKRINDAVAEEREECAKLVVNLFDPEDNVAEFIAKAIRARGNTK